MSHGFAWPVRRNSVVALRPLRRGDPAPEFLPLPLAGEGRGEGLRCATALGAALFLAACASGPPQPDWPFEAKAAVDRATSAYLEGNSRVEAAEMARARSLLSRNGRADGLANAELALCATRVASLVFEPCAGFEPLRLDTTPAQLAYADYLRGQATSATAPLLPEAQRTVATGGSSLPASSDALPQLVAAGVLLQAGRASPAVVAQAVEIASNQGWRRPLLAWLGVQRRLAVQSGQPGEVARIDRRLARIEAGLGPAPAAVTPTLKAP
jgi:hypothetical protein